MHIWYGTFLQKLVGSRYVHDNYDIYIYVTLCTIIRLLVSELLRPPKPTISITASLRRSKAKRFFAELKAGDLGRQLGAYEPWRLGPLMDLSRLSGGNRRLWWTS